MKYLLSFVLGNIGLAGVVILGCVFMAVRPLHLWYFGSFILSILFICVTVLYDEDRDRFSWPWRR